MNLEKFAARGAAAQQAVDEVLRRTEPRRSGMRPKVECVFVIERVEDNAVKRQFFVRREMAEKAAGERQGWRVVEFARKP